MSAADPSASPIQAWQRIAEMGRRAVFGERPAEAVESDTDLARTSVPDVHWLYAGAVFLLAAGVTFGWSFLKALQYDRNVANSAYAFGGTARAQDSARDSTALKASGKQPADGNAPQALIRPQEQQQQVAIGVRRTASPRRLEKATFAAPVQAAAGGSKGQVMRGNGGAQRLKASDVRTEEVASPKTETNARASLNNADGTTESVASTPKPQPALQQTAQLGLPPRETAAQPTPTPVRQTQERTNTEQLPPVQANPNVAKPTARPLERESSMLVPPRPVSKVMPDPRLVARTIIASPIQVRIVLDIDAKGHVTAAHMANGEMPKSALAEAALEAGRQWIFQPATLHGQKIACQHQIVFEFSGNQR